MGLGIGGEKVVDEGDQVRAIYYFVLFYIYISNAEYPGFRPYRDLSHVNPLGLFL